MIKLHSLTLNELYYTNLRRTKKVFDCIRLGMNNIKNLIHFYKLKYSTTILN